MGKIKNFDYDKFTHCLRIQVYPDKYEKARTENNLKFCLDYGVKNVMLFINAEEHHIGHMTIEEVKPWVECINRQTAIFKAHNISVGLNLWHTILHLDRGRKLKEGQNFTLMTDLHGKKCTCVSCMLDENWRNYFREFVKYVVTETNPDMFWIEDDFRLHNHAPLEYGGCFCDLHMKKYCEKLGKEVTRDQFVKNMLKPGEPTAERKAWMDVNKETMCDFSAFLAEIVQEAKPGLQIALMSSDPKKHMIEARDWNAIMTNFACGEKMIDRIHLPCYIEMQPKQYYWEFNSISMQCRALLPKQTLIYPELENISFSPFAKNKTFLKYQLESSIPLILSGMTYDIFDFLGNSCPDYGYGEVLRDLTPYFQKTMDMGVDFSDLVGVKVPLDENTCYKMKLQCGEKIDELLPYDSWFGSYFAMIGVNYQYTKDKQFKNQVVAIADQFLRTLSKDEIINLFSNNFVVMEGKAVETLCDLGLGSVAGIKSAIAYQYETNHQSYEQNYDGNDCMGIPGMKASSHINAGNWVDVVYDDNAVTTKLSGEFMANTTKVGEGAVLVNGKVAVIPYEMTGLLYDQMHELRVQNAKKMVWALNKNTDTPIAVMPITGVTVYLYKNESKTILMFVNSNLDDYENIEFYMDKLNIGRCKLLNRDGDDYFVNVKTNGNKVTIEEKLHHLSTKVFVIEN